MPAPAAEDAAQHASVSAANTDVQLKAIRGEVISNSAFIVAPGAALALWGRPPFFGGGS